MKLTFTVRIQFVAWSLYWLSLLLINLLYFKADHYPKTLLVVWTILYTLAGVGLFHLLTRIYRFLLNKNKTMMVIFATSLVFSFIFAYVWGIFEPLISWLINPAIPVLHINWDINSSGTFSKTFVMAFFSALYIFGGNSEAAPILQPMPPLEAPEKPEPPKTVSVYNQNAIVLLPIENIKKISVDGNYSFILDHRNHKYELKKTLKSWQEELPGVSFLRIHRSTLINRTFIERIEPWHPSTYRIHLTGLSEPQEVSRRYAALLKRELKL